MFDWCLVADYAVAAAPVVDGSIHHAIAACCSRPVSQPWRLMNLCLRIEKKDSAIALSQQIPVAPMNQAMVLLSQKLSPGKSVSARERVDQL